MVGRGRARVRPRLADRQVRSRFGPGWLVAHALPPLVWAGVIFWMSSRTGSQAADQLGPLAGVPLVSEAFHFGEYCLLAALVFRLLMAAFQLPATGRVPAAEGAPAAARPARPEGSGPWAQPRDLAIANLAGVAAFGYALSDEFHQTFVPGRTFSVEDLAVDLAGIVTGVGAAWAWRSWRSPR